MSSLANRLFQKKSITHIQTEAAKSPLKRTLGPLNLVSLGIGAIIGAGIFVITGNVAAEHTGPSVVISFLIAGVVCAIVGLCYAELASTMPVSGSAYTYTYGILGEVFAWTMGWLLVLEYGIAASTVAAGFSGHVVSLLHQFGINFPAIPIAGKDFPAFATPLIKSIVTDHGTQFALTGTFNVVAAIGVLFVTGLLILGVSESANINNIFVALKLIVIVSVILVGVHYINPANYHPFIPENTTHKFGEFGISGVLRGSAIIFFAYVGFEAVSTAAAESVNPKRDVPIGIIGALIVCTLLYIAMSLVVTGVLPYKAYFGSPEPIAIAIDSMKLTWADIPVHFAGGTLNLFKLAINIGIVLGLTSVMLVLCYGQTRIFYTMSRDGLLPKVISVLHQKFRTPWIGTIILGLVIAFAAGALPITLLEDLVSLGTALAFGIVCLSVIVLRVTHPEMDRPFRVPGGIATAVVGIILCLFMAGFNLFPMIDKAMDAKNPDFLPISILGGYILLGILVYIFYGYKNSKMGRGVDILDDDLESIGDAFAHGVDDKKK